MSKSDPGRFFEDFRLGEHIAHATPRTLTPADRALNIALTGSRYALLCSDPFAQECGLSAAPFDPLLVFHIVFGKSVPDISRNAVANLGYAEGRFFEFIYPGDTLRAYSQVIGLKPNSNGKTGIVTVRTRGANQHGRDVLEYVRWVMVQRRTIVSAQLPPLPLEGGGVGEGVRSSSAARASSSPLPLPPPPPGEGELKLAEVVNADQLRVSDRLTFTRYDWDLAGSKHAFEDYAIGEKIDHVDGMTVEEAEHQLATRLYQNTARVHFDALAQQSSRFDKRLIYGGVAISIARALAFNGLANAALMLAINGGRHVNPLFAGDTLYAWSEILDKADLGRVGALRLRLVAVKNRTAEDFPFKNAAGEYDPSVVLDFDYWAAVPKRS